MLFLSSIRPLYFNNPAWIELSAVIKQAQIDRQRSQRPPIPNENKFALRASERHIQTMFIRQESSDLAFRWQCHAKGERKDNDHPLATLKAINRIHHQPITKAFCQPQDMMANRRNLRSKRRDHANGARR